MSRTICLSVAMLAAALLLTAGGVPAQAQSGAPLIAQNDPFSTFFRQLFRPFERRREPPPEAAPRQRTAPASQPQRQRQRRQQPAQTAAPRVEPKDPDARQIVVFGDFFARGLRAGLEEAFAETSSVAVTGQSNASSGLVRDDFFDWPAAMRAYLEDDEHRVDLVVVMIGGNDRQTLRVGRSEYALRTDDWREVYTGRVDAVIDLFQEARIPVYWVGLPPVQSNRMTQDYAFFNELYRERVYRAGAQFIDIWNGFVDENGNFAMHGPDVNGEQRRLRNDDGLNFTSAGNRKLAHFVAREIRRDIGSDGELTAALPQGPVGPQPYVPGEEELESGIGQVVTLTGAPAQAMGLAGGPEPPPEPPDESAYYRTIILGEAPEPVEGRSDDFSWPREDE